MRRHDVVPGLTTLLLAFTLAGALTAPAAAKPRRPKAPPATVAAKPRRSKTPTAPSLAGVAALDSAARAASIDTTRGLRRADQPLDDGVLRLRRAAAEQRAGNARGVVAWLEPIDFAAATFPDADRAAFLLGQAYLKLGDTERFARVARSVISGPRQSAYTEWLERQLAMLDADGAPMSVSPGAKDSVAVSPRVAAQGSALALALEGPRLGARGAEDEASLAAISAADTTSALGRDLAGAALIRRATRRLARNEDATDLLQAVPAGSRYASTARHMLGLSSIEHGEIERGAAELRSLLASDSTYGARREVRLALAGLELDAGRWQEAEVDYAAADSDATLQRDALRRLRSGDSFDTLWTAWRAGDAAPDAVGLNTGPTWTRAQQLADGAADLGAPATTERPAPPEAPARVTPAPAPPPSAEEWRAVAMSARAVDEAREAAARASDDAERERSRLADARRYFGFGLTQVRAEADSLADRARQVEALKGHLDSLEARLRFVRDNARAHLMARARKILARCEAHATWIEAMDWLYVEGPHRVRPLHVPAGYPGPDSVLAAERGLTESVQALVAKLQFEWPGLLAVSYERAWRPGLIDRAATEAEQAAELLAAYRALDGTITAHIGTLGGSESLRQLEARAARLTAAAGERAAAHRALEAKVARAAIDRALAALEAEREGIDYGMAASAYALSVRLATGDTARTAGGGEEPHAVVIGAGAGRDSARTAAEDEGLDDPQAAEWRARAIPRLRSFLELHPRSPARADVRFRLADLLLVDERQHFREGMARFVHDQEQGGAEHVPLPVLSPEPALALYRAILAEDSTFAHRDAVLFNAGTILADQGDPESDALFQRLVTEHPDSRYAAEAYLRMGDLRFDGRRFAESVPLYQRAAAGGDPTLRAISLYKLGWAHFNGERFDDAADAFRAVMDVYDSTRAGAIQVDLTNEAESYLVHTLARAGGAAAFARHFEGSGSRPYERRVLRGLGSHFRRYSLYSEAAQTERLYLARYPLDPDALAAADRLIETYHRWDRVEETRAARLECAPMFAPGSPWARAQASDSVRAAGADFARSTWTAVAHEHHRRAREKGAAEDWREALRLYELLLATFPGDATAPATELDAGEASAKLGDHERALAHYATAAKTGADSVASQALWQRVAVADAWYESSRPPATRPATPAPSAATTSKQGHAATRRGTKAAPAPKLVQGVGRDTLARLVIENADQLLARFPDHPRGADLMWRQGQLGLAHGWDERAAADFGHLASARPNDARAPLAAGLRADALFRLGRYDDAESAYALAATAAHKAGNDSLERRANRAVPICAYRRAEAAVAADSSDHARAAALFEAVATKYPGYEHSALAQYRAGLAYLAGGDREQGVRALWVVVRSFGKSEYVKDAYLQIAKAEEKKDPRRSADAYAEFADRFPNDESAGAAWLQAADLYDGAGQSARADSLRLTYVRRRPNDLEMGMQVYETLARKELSTVGPDRPISTLLPPPAPKAAKTARRGTKAKPAPAPAAASAPASYIAEYLRRAKQRPDLASKPLMAQVRFLEGEEARGPYLATRLTQPLEKSIPAKQRRLDPLIARYRTCVDQGVPEWAHAATFRIGEALVAFGDALEHSERPADLKGDDLAAYDEVIAQQSQAFYDRGEAVWTELLKPQNAPSSAKPEDDRWLTLAQESLWKRLGTRFAYLPEAEFPHVEAEAPEKPKLEAAPAPAASGKRGGGSRQTQARAGGSPR